MAQHLLNTENLSHLKHFLLSHLMIMLLLHFLNPKKTISDFPEKLDLTLTKSLDLRYGENPHQKAAFYTSNNDYFVDSFAKFETLQGKQVSYNNIADSNAAWEIVQNFSLPSCAIVKHANPSGVSTSKDLMQRL